MPCVASEACWRKTLLFEFELVFGLMVLEEEDGGLSGILHTSMGMRSRWAAKMVFMRGMYCFERSVVRDTMRIRGSSVCARPPGRPSFVPE